MHRKRLFFWKHSTNNSTQRYCVRFALLFAWLNVIFSIAKQILYKPASVSLSYGNDTFVSSTRQILHNSFYLHYLPHFRVECLFASMFAFSQANIRCIYTRAVSQLIFLFWLNQFDYWTKCNTFELCFSMFVESKVSLLFQNSSTCKKKWFFLYHPPIQSRIRSQNLHCACKCY